LPLLLLPLVVVAFRSPSVCNCIRGYKVALFFVRHFLRPTFYSRTLKAILISAFLYFIPEQCACSTAVHDVLEESVTQVPVVLAPAELQLKFESAGPTQCMPRTVKSGTLLDGFDLAVAA
jgi:hypothetical protein